MDDVKNCRNLDYVNYISKKKNISRKYLYMIKNI